MVWLFLNCLFGERIITQRNDGTPMILKFFLLSTDMKLKDFLKLLSYFGSVFQGFDIEFHLKSMWIVKWN